MKQTIMNEYNIQQIINTIANEKNIDKNCLITSVEDAMLKAAQNIFGINRDLKVKFNDSTGKIELFQHMNVVKIVNNNELEISVNDIQRLGLDTEIEIGDEIKFQIFWHPDDMNDAIKQDIKYGSVLNIKQYRSMFSRTAVQVVKQILVQKIHDEEYNVYKNKKNELIKGVIEKIDNGNVFINLGNINAILPFNEKIPDEKYIIGQQITVILKSINKNQIILSRKDPLFIEKLFYSKIEEIRNGTIKIISCVRLPGIKSKIAVLSNNKNVDPISICNKIINEIEHELHGEKIDIIPYDKDHARFVCAAIQHAQVNKVIIDEISKHMELIVNDNACRFAIGHKGNNILLASQLTGWKLTVTGESKFNEFEKFNY
jgi:N utilization substance protein A